MTEECYLKEYMKCGDGSGGGFCNVGVERLRTASKLRGDTLYEQLLHDLSTKYKCHKTCVSSYTSRFHIKRYLSQHDKINLEPTAKRICRSHNTLFNFKKHCIICGEVCLEQDPRNPRRWRRVIKCRTADRGETQKTFKDVILETCNKRKDEWGNKVRLRILSSISDLHAADAQYHKDCMSSFRTNISDSGCKNDVDNAFHHVVDAMLLDKSRIWNALEIEETYKSYGGELLPRRQLTQRLSDYFKSDLLILSATGIVNILAFRNTASKLMKVVVSDIDDTEAALERVAKKITMESLHLKRDMSTYNTRICLDDALNSCSPTLLNLLSKISPKFDSSLPAALVGNMVTAAISKRPTSLQISLGVVIREKAIIELLYEFGITSSYDEILRFKGSAAHAAAKCRQLFGISNDNVGLVQVVADNFDANISSPNGLQSTHALAILVTQTQQHEPHSALDRNQIRRLSKSEMSDDVLPDVPIQHYVGPKKPEMPDHAATSSPLPLKLLASQYISVNRARETDFKFISDIMNKPHTPEFGGYNTNRSREQGHSIKPKTRAVYLPLIDMAPAEPSTVMTAMVEAERITNATGQIYTIFTNDQQLYRIAVNITWVYSEKFINFIPRLGGMHTIMNFVGCIGTLMSDSGLEQIMNVAFGGVSKMLGGKKYPQNVRALRMVVEELLHNVVNLEQIQNYSQLIDELKSRAARSRTTQLWLDNLIKPVFIMMLFIRAEREGDWPLHLLATQQMMPYFFSSGHCNYARYCLYYLRSMSKLPNSVLKEFMQGRHVMRHQPGIWNGISSDQFIESTFMRYGHSPGGIIGFTLKPSTIKRWALGLHICAQLKRDIFSMTDKNAQTIVITHKEEGHSRVQNDATDREKIRNKLLECIDPLNPDSHPPGLVNIATGRISPDSVNVDQSLYLGTHLMKDYEQGWPQSFNKPLKKNVVLMSASRKQIKVNDIPVFDTSLIYSRVLGLQNARDINLKDVLSYELAGIPPSMFDESSGEMRLQSSKSTLKKKLQVEVSNRTSSQADGIILDGCAVLWIIAWPDHGIVEDFIRNVVSYVNGFLQTANTYLVFDRYYSKSIKQFIRTARAGKDACRRHQLSLDTSLPPKKVCLTVPENKSQLISIICKYFSVKHHLLPHNGNRLVVTGAEATPIEICNGVIVERPDLRTTHEEADIIIIQQVVHMADRGMKTIYVIADDTDVFVLLAHFYKERNLTCNLVMTGTSATRSSVDIKATVEKHSDIVGDLLPAHALSGCDTVSYLWGIGKSTVVKILKSKRALNKLGNINEQIPNVVSEATKFIAACYGFPLEENMTSLRYIVWSNKMSNNKLNSAPDLKVLPPTAETFEKHVCRAHLQAAIWRCALNPDPPNLNPIHYGWMYDVPNKCYLPIAIPSIVSPVPVEVLKLIKCGCSSSRPCSTSRCSCTSAQLSCSIFCACCGGDECRNQRTIASISVEDNDDNEDVELTFE